LTTEYLKRFNFNITGPSPPPWSHVWKLWIWIIWWRTFKIEKWFWNKKVSGLEEYYTEVSGLENVIGAYYFINSYTVLTISYHIFSIFIFLKLFVKQLQNIIIYCLVCYTILIVLISIMKNNKTTIKKCQFIFESYTSCNIIENVLFYTLELLMNLFATTVNI